MPLSQQTTNHSSNKRVASVAAVTLVIALAIDIIANTAHLPWMYFIAIIFVLTTAINIARLALRFILKLNRESGRGQQR